MQHTLIYYVKELMCTVHAGLRSNTIPETPAPRTTSKVSPFSSSLSQDNNNFRLDGSAMDPITLGDSDSNDDSEPEMVPLCRRIGIGSSTASIAPSLAAGSKTSLTPSQAAGAAALKRLNALENRTKCSIPPLLDLDGDRSPKGKKSASMHQKAKQRAAGSRSSAAVKELFHEQAPSTFDSTSSNSVSLSRTQTSHQSTTGEQGVDLSSPEFILRPGTAICNVHIIYIIAKIII